MYLITSSNAHLLLTRVINMVHAVRGCEVYGRGRGMCVHLYTFVCKLIA